MVFISGFFRMKALIFLHITVLAGVCVAQQECWRGACYPPLGEILLGREGELKATSTCGLNGIEVFCTPFGQGRMKCCPCDSRNPEGRDAHTIQNVLSSAGAERWWQSRKDVNPVTIELDLKQLFHLDTLLLHFKGPRPDALIIERSSDFGQTWSPAIYMATDCTSTFPHVSTATTYDLDSPHCYTLPSNRNNPYQDQRVNFHPLLQFSNVLLPQERKIQKLSGYTGLRINLTRFGEVPYTPGRHPSRFYALKEVKVTGSCFCHGHAQRCLSGPASNYLPSIQVNGVCDCQHNTAGVNCERCADLFNDLPWQPAERDDSHTCQRCECNNHADRCYFDSELYERSGRKTGGVCEECKHNTAGIHCELCAPNYYRNPYSNMQRSDTCLPCQCDSAGSVGCDEVTGVCRCKDNVEGPRCDRCKPGYFGLSGSDPLGCSKCSCDAAGSIHGDCDAVTGQCVCQPGVEGRSCDRCAEGFWNSPSGCQSCNCDITNTINNKCDQLTGQCVCRPGFGGRTCSGCPENTYGDALSGCRACTCARAGTVPGGCDSRTGECVCKEGVVGKTCDRCSRGHCDLYPQCPVCPSCFFSLDSELKNLTLWLNRLSNTMPGTSDPAHPRTLQRITQAQHTLRRITQSLLQLPNDGDLYTIHENRSRTLRSQLMKITDGLRRGAFSPPDLQRELRTLQDQLSDLHVVYDAKKNAAIHFDDSNYLGVLDAVKNAFSRSADAEKLANGAPQIINTSASVRDAAVTNLNRIQPNNTKNLQKLLQDLATRPNLTPTAVQQVCGSKRVSPCSPHQCEGELCPAEGAPPCAQGEKCVGALPWSHRAGQDSTETKKKLQQLNDKISQAYTQIQESQSSTNQVRLSTDELANQMKRSRDDINDELKDVKNFLQKLKDFLSDPSSDPAVVQRVCDGVLGVKLPDTVDALKKKLKEIEGVASSLPDSTAVLKTAESQLDQAHRLLQDAEKARDTALGLQDSTDGVLVSLNEGESALNDMEDKLQRSLDLINNAKQNVAKVEWQLVPAEGLVKEGSDLVESLRPLLDSLREEELRGRKLAEEAAEQAEGAKHESTAAARDLALLQEQLEKLKQNANLNSLSNTAGNRLHTLQGEATLLIQDTADIMRLLTDKEASLQGARGELMSHAQHLHASEARLRELINNISAKANQLAVCQG